MKSPLKKKKAIGVIWSFKVRGKEEVIKGKKNSISLCHYLLILIIISDLEPFSYC